MWSLNGLYVNTKWTSHGPPVNISKTAAAAGSAETVDHTSHKIGEVPTMKIISDKRASVLRQIFRQIFRQMFVSRSAEANMNFQIVVALA